MTGTRDRQRAAARARLEREMSLRAEQAQRRRRRATVIGGAAAAVVVVLAVTWIIVAATGGKKASPTASPTPADANAGICIWQPNPALSGAPKPTPVPSASEAPVQVNPDLRNTGTPPAKGLPHSGHETMTVATNQGTVTIQLDLTNAPCAAASMSYLAGKKFFDNTACHRMTDASLYVLQCGDPSGTGKGGPGYTFADENLPSGKRPTYAVGDVAMANSGPNTNGSQFFIVYRDTEDKPDDGSGQAASALDASYTIIGHVTTGLDVVQKIAAGGLVASSKDNPNDGKPKLPVTVTSVTVSQPS